MSVVVVTRALDPLSTFEVVLVLVVVIFSSDRIDAAFCAKPVCDVDRVFGDGDDGADDTGETFASVSAAAARLTWYFDAAAFDSE